jgi:hypothetical protein
VLVTSLKSVSFAIAKTMWWKPALNGKTTTCSAVLWQC